MNKIFSAIFLFFMFVASSFGQSQTGSLKGKVTTTEGRGASDVTIALKNKSKGTVTDENGLFEFRKLAVGDYEIEISLVGYETLSQSVAIESGKQQEVSLQLKLSGRELEEVVVKSAGRGYKISKPSSTLRLQGPLLEVPQNIQVVTSKTLADQQIFDMLDGVTRNVSGAARSEHWDNYANITMRGTTIG
ncbi:MAG: carboxypeptidase-like regulatory domain-containing protein, partial [Flavitalea sp.]